MEMIMNLPVEELTSKTRYNAISSIYPHLAVPIENDKFKGYTRKTDHFSSFSNHYKVGEEREFIAELIEKNPGKYIKFIIAWSDSN
jgi:hypothetical protein